MTARKPPERRQDRHKARSTVVTLAPAAPPAPEPPEELLKSTAALWNEFWSSDIARAWQGPDIDGLRRLIVYRDEWQRMINAHRAHRFVEGSMGQAKVSPALEVALKLEAAMGRLAADLGLSPLARMRLGIAFGQAAKTAEQLRDDAYNVTDDEPDPRFNSVEVQGE